jgi:hypothetical protein
MITLVTSRPGPPLPIEPFSIHVGEPVLSDLRARIRNTRWPDQAPGPAWEQGTDLVRRWAPMPSGGHFAPAEEPERLARDIAAFFAAL